LVLQQRPARDACGAPRFRPLPVGGVVLGPMQRAERGFQVHERIPLQHELYLGPSGDQLRADDMPKLREQDVQPRMVVRIDVGSVDRTEELIPSKASGPVEHQVGEEHPPLAARQRFLHAPAADSHSEPSAELDPRPILPSHRLEA
jgi:hypothetical protein